MPEDTKTSRIAASGGVGEITWQPKSRQTWVVDQVSVKADTVGGSAACAIYKNSSFITPLVPQGDAAVGPPPITLQPNDKLRVRWTSGTANEPIEATIIYDVK